MSFHARAIDSTFFSSGAANQHVDQFMLRSAHALQHRFLESLDPMSRYPEEPVEFHSQSFLRNQEQARAVAVSSATNDRTSHHLTSNVEYVLQLFSNRLAAVLDICPGYTSLLCTGDSHVSGGYGTHLASGRRPPSVRKNFAVQKQHWRDSVSYLIDASAAFKLEFQRARASGFSSTLAASGIADKERSEGDRKQKQKEERRRYLASKDAQRGINVRTGVADRRFIQ
jgi:hypothetical protein